MTRVVERQRQIAEAAASEVYVGTARDVHIGYCGRNEAGGVRERCYPCHVEAPLSDPQVIWGEYPDRAEREQTCDRCGRVLQEIADDQQAAHDMQQARWARASRVEYVIEMGATAAIRCRVY